MEQNAARYDEVIAVNNQAEHAAPYAKQARDKDSINKATAIRTRAMRKAGEMLAQTRKARGAKRPALAA